MPCYTDFLPCMFTPLSTSCRVDHRDPCPGKSSRGLFPRRKGANETHATPNLPSLFLAGLHWHFLPTGWFGAANPSPFIFFLMDTSNIGTPERKFPSVLKSCWLLRKHTSSSQAFFYHDSFSIMMFRAMALAVGALCLCAMVSLGHHDFFFPPNAPSSATNDLGSFSAPSDCGGGP